MQVVPIYGRGGENTDPRQKVQAPAKNDAEDEASVPRRPAGQRVEPVQVRVLYVFNSCFPLCLEVTGVPQEPGNSCPWVCAQRTQLIQPGNGSLQPGLGIIPTLFGLQHAPGARAPLPLFCAGHCNLGRLAA